MCLKSILELYQLSGTVTIMTAPDAIAHETGGTPGLLAERLITIEEIARALRVSPATVRYRVRSGDLAAVQIGREYRVTATAWTDYCARLGLTPAATVPAQGAV